MGKRINAQSIAPPVFDCQGLLALWNQQAAVAERGLAWFHTAFAVFLVVVGTGFPSLQEKNRYEVQLG